MTPRDKITTPRDLERFLRARGFSVSESKLVVKFAWRPLAEFAEAKK